MCVNITCSCINNIYLWFAMSRTSAPFGAFSIISLANENVHSLVGSTTTICMCMHMSVCRCT